MFYVKRSWQSTLFLSLFIIQEEQWKSPKRGVWKWSTAQFSPQDTSARAPPRPEDCCSLVLLCPLLSPSLSILPIELCLSEKLKKFSVDEAEKRPPWSLWGSRLSSHRSTARLFNKWRGRHLFVEIIHILYYIHTHASPVSIKLEQCAKHKLNRMWLLFSNLMSSIIVDFWIRW